MNNNLRELAGLLVININNQIVIDQLLSSKPVIPLLLNFPGQKEMSIFSYASITSKLYFFDIYLRYYDIKTLTGVVEWAIGSHCLCDVFDYLLRKGWTPHDKIIYFSVCYNSIDILDRAINCGCDINSYCWVTLMATTTLPQLHRLVMGGINLHVTDRDGNTLLDSVSGEKKQWLIDLGA
jgi:hypothetical protein